LSIDTGEPFPKAKLIFFVFSGERKLAFEVKSSSVSNIKVHKGLKAFKKIYSDFEQIIITFDRFSRHDDITYIPGWMI
jgi:predicted AAA+ superfamily ATPase